MLTIRTIKDAFNQLPYRHNIQTAHGLSQLLEGNETNLFSIAAHVFKLAKKLESITVQKILIKAMRAEIGAYPKLASQLCMSAIDNHNVEAIALLLAAGFQANKLFKHAIDTHNLTALKLLLAAGFNVHQPVRIHPQLSYVCTYLHYAAAKVDRRNYNVSSLRQLGDGGSIELVKCIFEGMCKTMDPAKVLLLKDSQGNFPISKAAANELENVVDWLSELHLKHRIFEEIFKINNINTIPQYAVMVSGSGSGRKVTWNKTLKAKYKKHKAARCLVQRAYHKKSELETKEVKPLTQKYESAVADSIAPKVKQTVESMVKVLEKLHTTQETLEDRKIREELQQVFKRAGYTDDTEQAPPLNDIYVQYRQLHTASPTLKKLHSPVSRFGKALRGVNFFVEALVGRVLRPINTAPPSTTTAVLSK